MHTTGDAGTGEWSKCMVLHLWRVSATICPLLTSSPRACHDKRSLQVPYLALMSYSIVWLVQVTGSTTIPAQNSMLYGALAAVTSATVSFPLEVVRRRMMMGTASGNTLTAIVAIAQNEGVASL